MRLNQVKMLLISFILILYMSLGLTPFWNKIFIALFQKQIESNIYRKLFPGGTESSLPITKTKLPDIE